MLIHILLSLTRPGQTGRVCAIAARLPQPALNPARPIYQRIKFDPAKLLDAIR